MDFVEIKLISSLEKVFPGDALTANEQKSGSMLKNEMYSFQLAAKTGMGKLKASIGIKSPVLDYISVYTVGNVQSDLPAYEWRDDDYLKTEPGLFPDILFDNKERSVDLIPDQWCAIWFFIDGSRGIKAGEYPIEITLTSESGEAIAFTQYQLEVIDKELPKQTLIHTEWFYTDALSEFYQTEIFSEKYWKLVEAYVKTAVKYGVNMLLTPVFHPPFTSKADVERPIVQLVDVFITQGQYRFEFGRLKRWIELAKACGMEYFEFTHLYSQWGAKNAPRIMAKVDGEAKQIFGWQTNAAESEYKNFVVLFLKELLIFLEKEQINKKCYFHVSDEPTLEHLETYKDAADTMKSVLKNEYKIFDALSDFEFYSTGAVQYPVPANDHIDKFLENHVEQLWTYYCCAQGDKVSNRFMSMPSYRNRIIGLQLYKFNIYGFLHWGYNSWYNFDFTKLIDPFKVTDAEKAFPSGDPFLVYPGESGPILSIRLLVLNEALQDIRALQLLESLASREEVLALIEQGCENELTFSEYPRSADYILNLRAQLNEKLKHL